MSERVKYCALSIVLLVGITACQGEYQERTGSTTEATVAIKLPVTGQTLCYDAAGIIVTCSGSGQDGELLKGGTGTIQRFSDQNNGTMLDNDTGLIWLRDASAPGLTTCIPGATNSWQNALDYVTCLNTNSYLGFSDWRLPNVLELRSLVNISQPDISIWLISQGFTGVQSDDYWSSSSAGDGPSSAWVVGMEVGDVDGNDKSDRGYAWPVRSVQNESYPYSQPSTGQEFCYDFTGAVTTCVGTGQDGETQKGSPWSNSRFFDVRNGTIQDNLTGLVWSIDANAPGPAVCTPATTKNWQSSLDYVKCLNTNSYLGFSDWRLPNRTELSSLIDYAQLNQATWLTSLGFSGVQAVYYWSSSSSAESPSDAWGVDMGDGDIDGDAKSYSQYVWPVRSMIEIVNIPIK